MGINWCYSTSFIMFLALAPLVFTFTVLLLLALFNLRGNLQFYPRYFMAPKVYFLTLWILFIEFYLYTVFCSDYWPLIWFLPSAPLHYYIYFSVLLTNITYQRHYRVTVPVFLHFYFCTADQLIAFIWFSIYLI